MLVFSLKYSTFLEPKQTTAQRIIFFLWELHIWSQENNVLFWVVRTAGHHLYYVVYVHSSPSLLWDGISFFGRFEETDCCDTSCTSSECLVHNCTYMYVSCFGIRVQSLGGTTLFRNKRFALNLMPKRNASKFAIFYVWENPCSFFRFSFHATLYFYLMNALVYVDINQGIH